MTDFALARTMMVDNQVRPSDVTDPRIIGAMLETPREDFVPSARRALAYIDEDLLVREGESGRRYLMAPTCFAKLVQFAAVKPGDLVLDVGCATGYSAAILARLAESVVALDCDSELVEAANEALLETGIANVAVVQGALAAGYPGEGPYDVIVLEGGVDFVPRTLIDQLKEGGRLVAVVGAGRSGRGTLFKRLGDDVASLAGFDCAAEPLPGFTREAEFIF